MEWRIVLGVLCLIGILPVPGNAANDTNATVFEFNLSFSINETFIADYSNMSANATIELKNNITSQIEPLFRNIQNFLRMVIQKFRNGSIVTDSILQFSNGTRPNVTSLKQTLVDRVTNGSFLNIIQNSINITESVSLPGVNTTNTTAPVTVFNVTFKIDDQFIAAYSNLSDPVTQKLESNITTQVSSVFKKKIQSFIRMFIRTFRNGSIDVDGGFEFDKNTTTADVKTVAITLRDAVLNKEFTFPVDPNSIKVTDSSGNTSSRSPVLASMLTALWMTLASLLLSAMMHL